MVSVTADGEMGQGKAVRTRTLEVRVIGTGDVTTLATCEPVVCVFCHIPIVVVQDAIRTADHFIHRNHTLPHSTSGEDRSQQATVEVLPGLWHGSRSDVAGRTRWWLGCV